MKTLIHTSILALAISATAVTPRAEVFPETDELYSQVNREYAYELIRYLYRWYLDDDLFIYNPAVREATEVEFWLRPLKSETDENDKSLFVEVLLPVIKTVVVLKKADYEIPEMGLHIKNERFKVSSVDRYESPSAPESEYIKILYDRSEVVEYLYETRNDRFYPSEAVQLRVDAALQDRMEVEKPEGIEGDQLVYFAPVSPVSNEFWIFWENTRKIIRFSSDADIDKPESWVSSTIGIEIYDLDHDIVISLIEKPGSNAFITKDAVGRILFNCVVLGRRKSITAEQLEEWQESVHEQRAATEGKD